MTEPSPSDTKEVLFSYRQVIDIVIQLAVSAVFLVASYNILRPFIHVIAAGGIIAIAVYPLFLGMVERFGGRRKIVLALFILLGAGVIVVPVFLASTSLFDGARTLYGHLEEGTLDLPPPPSKVQDWPLVGDKLHSIWVHASTNLQSFVSTYYHEMTDLFEQAVSAVAGAGSQVLQFVVSILIAAVFLANAEACAVGLDALTTRLVGEARGRDFNQLAVKTMRSVATGVLGVAFVQAVLAAVGMAVAGVPWIGIWSLTVLLLAIMQLPPLIILLPVAFWVLGTTDNNLIAWGFMVWSILVGFSDAVLKPLFLGRGVEIPMIVILLGAIGGMIMSGIMGLFVGAVILALSYRLLVEWLRQFTVDAPQPTSVATQENL